MFEMSLEQTSISEQQIIVSKTNNAENKETNVTNILLKSWNTNSKEQRVEQHTIPLNEGSSELFSSTTTMGNVGPSPLDQLIKLHARLNHDEELAYSTSSSSTLQSTPSTLSHLKDSHTSCNIQQSKHSEDNINASTHFIPLTNSQQQLACLPSYSSPFVIDPSSPSALLSSYAQLAAAASPWTSWSGEMAALLCSGEGEGILNNSATGFSRGGWCGDGYLGNALGAFVPPPQTSFANNTFLPQATGEHSPQSYQPFSASSFADLKTLATTSRAVMQQSNHDLKSSDDGTFFPNMNNHQLQQNQIISSSRASLISKYVQQKRSHTSSGSQQNKNKAGGKIRSSVKSKNDCVCPNCMELQRTGAQLDEENQKHNCHFPGCYKVYSRSSHLKAHLRWHRPDRPPTTKRRLFDPPEGPPPPQPISITKSLNINVQIKHTVQSGQNSSSSTE